MCQKAALDFKNAVGGPRSVEETLAAKNAAWRAMSDGERRALFGEAHEEQVVATHVSYDGETCERAEAGADQWG